MRWSAHVFPILAALGLTATLGACARLTPQTAPAPPLPSAARNILLSDLAHCGVPTSAACARIHVALAHRYLSGGPLNDTALGNAARELRLAAQNDQVAAETLPLRRVVHALRAHTTTKDACITELRLAQTRSATAQAQSAAAQARLNRLEKLLREHAAKSLDHHVLKQP